MKPLFFPIKRFLRISEDINDLVTVAAAQKFCQTGKCITKVGLSNVCTHDQEGNEVPKSELVFPYKVTFDLTGEVNFKEEKPSSMEEFMDQFKVNMIPPVFSTSTMKNSLP